MKKLYKKIVPILLIAIMILSVKVSAYSEDKYSIELPENYYEISENLFCDINGNSIHVVIEKHNGGVEYTEKNLNKIIEKTEKNADEIISSQKKEAEEQFKDTLTKEQIDEIFNSMRFEGFDLKEVSTFTKNNYPCFHCLSKITVQDITIYQEGYMVASNNETFEVNISSTDKDYFESNEVKNIINSFTIKNYKEVDESNKKLVNDLIWNILELGFFVCIAVVGLSKTIKTRKLAKKNNEMENKEESQDKDDENLN